MWEGPSYNPSALEVNHELLKSQLQRNNEEIHRLRKLLDVNGISWAKPQSQPSSSTKLKCVTRSSNSGHSTLFPRTRSVVAKQKNAQRRLPHLPNEVLLRILKATVVQSHPVIDPFWKLLPENLTGQEQKRTGLNLGFLSTNKFFRNEGIKLFIMNNQFIFTQASALQNFANFSLDSRATIEHVTLRIVAKYYDDTAYKKVLRGNCPYHALLESPLVWVKARPVISPMDKGIQAYSWQQFLDFLQALVLYHGASSRDRRLAS